MMTFSVNIGLPTETISYPLHEIISGTFTYFDDILLRLEDNQLNTTTSNEFK